MQALLTGFEGFAGKINPSGKIAKALDGERIDGLKVSGKELPEDFYTLRTILRQIVRRHKPDILISTGWDYVSLVKVEKISLNLMNSIFGDKIVPDNSGNAPRGEDVIPHAPLALRATIPAERIAENLSKRGIPSQISFHAGTHCCNEVMYSGIYYTRKAKPRSIAGFIHIPPISEMEIERAGVQPMKFEKELEAIKISLETCREFLQSK